MKAKVAYLLALSILGGAFLRAAEDDLLSPKITEQWEPVPPVVSAPVGVPPSDAIVLFDGTSLDVWELVNDDANPWNIVDGAMIVPKRKKIGIKTISSDIRTKQDFGDIQLHIEFRTPQEVKGSSQARGNSGIFFMERYELQVLDSYQNETYANGQAGAIYKQHPPLVNASRAPGEWQAYDIVFVAPVFDDAGKLIRAGRITAFHNGVLIQHHAIIRGPTEYRKLPRYSAHPARLPLRLQDHGNPVAYRNIWVRELDLPDSNI